MSGRSLCQAQESLMRSVKATFTTAIADEGSAAVGATAGRAEFLLSRSEFPAV